MELFSWRGVGVVIFLFLATQVIDSDQAPGRSLKKFKVQKRDQEDFARKIDARRANEHFKFKDQKLREIGGANEDFEDFEDQKLRNSDQDPGRSLKKFKVQKRLKIDFSRLHQRNEPFKFEDQKLRDAGGVDVSFKFKIQNPEDADRADDSFKFKIQNPEDTDRADDSFKFKIQKPEDTDRADDSFKFKIQKPEDTDRADDSFKFKIQKPEDTDRADDSFKFKIQKPEDSDRAAGSSFKFKGQ